MFVVEKCWIWNWELDFGKKYFENIIWRVFKVLVNSLHCIAVLTVECRNKLMKQIQNTEISNPILIFLYRLLMISECSSSGLLKGWKVVAGWSDRTFNVENINGITDIWYYVVSSQRSGSPIRRPLSLSWRSKVNHYFQWLGTKLKPFLMVQCGRTH